MEPKLFLPQAETNLEAGNSDPEIAKIQAQEIERQALSAVAAYFGAQDSLNHHFDANWEFSDPSELR